MSAPNLTRALAELPSTLHGEILAHPFPDERLILIAETWLQFQRLRKGEPLEKALKRARSKVRRESQDPASYGVGIEAIDSAVAERLAQGRDANDAPVAPGRKRKPGTKTKSDGVIRRQVEEDLGVGPRRAQQIIKEMVQAHQQGQQGDLFLGLGEKEEEDEE